MNTDVKYDDKAHAYTVNGKPVPSVTQIISWYQGNKYAEVPADILQRAKDYGTGVHEAIEKYINTLEVDGYEDAVAQYAVLEEEHRIGITSTEQIVNYGERYAGRYDMIGEVDGDASMIDIKTTYRLDKEYLGLQLGLYRMALQKPLKCFCVWLPKKGKAQLVEIEPEPEDKLKEILDAYEVAHR